VKRKFEDAINTARNVLDKICESNHDLLLELEL